MDSNFCCPNPDNTVIQPDAKAWSLRKQLRFVIFGEIFAVVAKFILLSPFSGLMQLISMWIVYVAWATMHFCSTMIVIFSCSIDLIFMGMAYNQIMMRVQGSPILQIMFYVLLAFYVYGVVTAVRAYMCWKKIYQAQHGGGYQSLDNQQRPGFASAFSNRYDGPAGYDSTNQSQPRGPPGQNRVTGFSGQGVAVGNSMPAPGAQSTQSRSGGFSAFQGTGHKLGGA